MATKRTGRDGMSYLGPTRHSHAGCLDALKAHGKHTDCFLVLLVFVLFLRQGLAMYFRLALNAQSCLNIQLLGIKACPNPPHLALLQM
jgi:hypothetical protein